MSSKTPSGRRRAGREAYCPGSDPKDSCPYNPNSWGYEEKLKDFIEGWEEEENKEAIKKEYNEFCELCGHILEWDTVSRGKKNCSI